MANRTYQEGVIEGKRQMASRMLDVLTTQLDCTNDSELASWFGIEPASVSQWRAGTASPQKSKLKTIFSSLLSCWVQPIFEIEPIAPAKVGATWDIDRDSAKRSAMREQLDNRRGIYVFFDSRGHITYAGQAKMEGKQTSNLYTEIEQRLAQKLRHQMFSWAGTKIDKQDVIQGDVVRFMSAYETTTGAAAHNLEALLMRITINSVQNRQTGTLRVGKWEA